MWRNIAEWNRCKFSCAKGLASLSAIAAVVFAGGCASYMTPGRAADFHAMGITPQEVEAQTDFSIAQRLDRKPLAAFPTNLAVARVQAPEYRSRTACGIGLGHFSVVTTRDVETDEDFKRLQDLKMIDGIAALNRLVLPPQLTSEEDLRKAAASVQADMLLVYTFDTRFETRTKVKPLGLITLGLFPDRVASVTSTASAALLDTRNGYIYGLAEGTSQQSQLSNAWNNEEALDEVRRKTEHQAFAKLVDEFEKTWQSVVARYGPNQDGAVSLSGSSIRP